jgi:hypothetical protein
MKINYDEDDLDTGELDQAAVEAEQLNTVRSIKTIRIYGKCSDRSHTVAKDASGKRLLEAEGYVKYGLGLGGGDDIEIEVDIETGKIVGWQKPTDDALLDAFYGEDR